MYAEHSWAPMDVCACVLGCVIYMHKLALAIGKTGK